MRHRHAKRSGRERLTVALRYVAYLSLVLFLVLAIPSVSDRAGPPQPGGDQAIEAGQAEAASPLSPSAPTRVRIPSIRVDAPLAGLDLDAEGRLASPPAKDRNLAGWYERGVTPGERGTAIIAGHVDVPSGRAVFYDLGALRKGMHVEVDRADGSTARFAIDAIEAHAADDFPDERVYGARDRPELRLITCGGGFDEKAGRYRGNVVVYAHLTHD